RYANTLTNASASEFGIIYARGDTPSDFILTGRMLERIWLTATSCGVQMQPLTGTVFMNFFIKENPEGHFTERERTLIRKQIDTLYTIVGGGKVVTFMFRAGYAPAASARASRFALEELLLS
ncbi:MAG: hypothetical protein Q7S26_01515, partial [bacterium]|nr:hypothetical protein [bacterium]